MDKKKQEILYEVLQAIDLQVNENDTITELKNGRRVPVSCNNKQFSTMSEYNKVSYYRQIVLNLNSNWSSCSYFILSKYISSSLEFKINNIFSKIIDLANSDFHSKEDQKLNLLLFNLHKFDNGILEQVEEKWIKISNIINEHPFYNILIKFNPRYMYVKVQDEIKIKKYNKKFNILNSSDYIYNQKCMKVIFPLCNLFTNLKNNTILGIKIDKTDIKIFKMIFEYIFVNINEKDTFIYPSISEYEKSDRNIVVVKKDYQRYTYRDEKNETHMIDNFYQEDHTIMLLKLFLKIANNIDPILHELNLDENMYDISFTEDKLNLFLNEDSISFGNRYDVIKEVTRNRQFNFISLNDELNDKLIEQNKIVVQKEKLGSVKKSHLIKRNIPISQGFSSFGSSFPSVPIINSNPIIFDPTNESFQKLIPNNERLKHTYILGGTGAGKSEVMKTIIYRDIVENKSSIILLEPHGDLALEVAKMVKDKKRLIYIDPFSKKGLIPTINPFELTKKNEETISIMTQELVSAFENGLGLEWSHNMEAVLAPCISTLLRKENSDIYELQRFMDDMNNTDLVKLGKESPIKGHQQFFKTQFNKEKLVITKDAIATKLQLLLNDPVFTNLITGKSTINLEKEMNNNKKIIIFKLSKGKMRNTLKLYSRLMMATIQGIVLKRESIDEKERPHTHLYLDEFHNFIGSTTEEILAESRKYKLFVVMAHQTLTQLDTKMKGMVLSNTDIKIIGKNSYDNINTMSKEIQVDKENLENLNTGEFYLKFGTQNACKIINTDNFIGVKSAVTNKIWTKYLKYQYRHYYRDVEESISKNTNNKLSFENDLKPSIDTFKDS